MRSDNCNKKNIPVCVRPFSTPPATWKSPVTAAVMMPMSERKAVSCKRDLFHVVHKVPIGDSPYVRAKHVQLIDKDPSRAISLFWAAINAGDRVDSALKDMAVVMKQLNRTDEAIEAIKSFRHLCPYDSQESIDNVLVELYKRSGRIEEEIEMLQHKLKNIEEGIAFGGKRTKIARSQGKKIQITVEQEKSRILGNLAWAHLQRHNYGLAEQHYRKALSLEPDKNKECNLAICLMHMNRIPEAKSLLQSVRVSCGSRPMDNSYAKSFERAFQVLTELESQLALRPTERYEENQIPLKEVTSSTNAGQSYKSEFMDSGMWADEYNGETVLLGEQNRGSYSCYLSGKQDNFFEYHKGSSKCISSGPRGNSQSSPTTAVDDNWRRGSYFESSGERSSFVSKMKENRTNSAHRKNFASPAPVLYTQPRRCSWGFNKGDQKRESWVEDRVEHSAENMLAHTARSLNGELLDSADEKLEFTPQKSQSSLLSSTGRDWRRRPWRDVVGGKDVAVLEPLSQPTMKGQTIGTYCGYDSNAGSKDAEVTESNSQHTNWKRNAQANGGQRKSAMEVGSNSTKLHTEQDMDIHSAKVLEACGDGKQDNSSGVTDPGNVKSTDTLGDNSLGRKVPSKPFCKSWADMVEEEEGQLFAGEDISECYDGWSCEDESNDENLNSNMIYQYCCPKIQVETITEKLEGFDLKDGYGSSRTAVTSRNQTVRRSLCFEAGKDTSKKNRNRLQVFRDITPSPDSP